MGIRLARVFLPDRAIRHRITNWYETLRRSAHAARQQHPPKWDFKEDEAKVNDIPAWDFVCMDILPALSHSFELDVHARSNMQRARLILINESGLELCYAVRQFMADYVN